MQTKVSRPKIQDRIIPQSEIERGDDELAYLLKERHENSSVAEITFAYHISKHKCPCPYDDRYYPCLVSGEIFKTFKELFYHFRQSHYQPLSVLTADLEDAKSMAELQRIAKQQFERRCALRHQKYEDDKMKVTRGLISLSHFSQLKREFMEFLDTEDQFIDTRLDLLVDGLETHKEAYNRIYSMFQHFVTIEANWVTRGRIPTKILKQRRAKKYTAFYLLGKEFLFMDKQLEAMFDIPVSDLRRYSYYGLDAYYGGEANYPAWMKRVLAYEPSKQPEEQ